MPIYEYHCAACGHRHDALQKVSDAPLTDCPHCGAAALSKALTAAGFQLKGSGWYATDFKGGQAPAKTDKAADKPAEKTADAPAGAADGAPSATTSSPAAAAPASGAPTSADAA
jgi:putative FmdB family regulatory protein